MQLEGSLSRLQVPATCHYSEPHQPSPCSTSNFLKNHLNIILLFTPGSSKWSLSLRFPHQKTAYISFLPIHVTWSAHLILHDLITRIISGEEYRSLSLSICSFIQSNLTLSHIGTNILLNTLFSNTVSLRSSLNVSDHIPNPYKTTGKIMVQYTVIFIFLDS
jgi:hypothetical protein